MTEYNVTHVWGSIDRREAIKRVTALMGGVALVGGSALLDGCRQAADDDETFTPDEIAFLDEVAETILPETSTPGAKAAGTGAFMALMVTDSYSARDQKVFRDGMRALDRASRDAYDTPFMSATPQQRLALLQDIDREQRAHSEARRAEERAKSLAYLSDQRQEAVPGEDVGAAAAVTESPPAHYFRMMKELALLGYFTSEIGCTQAQRYIESPGRFEPCVPYSPGEKSWAPHA
ncbi:MAG: gluconate 2-dehydrogenase subunit 3 family protein [Longimicrobiales bacterium]